MAITRYYYGSLPSMATPHKLNFKNMDNNLLDTQNPLKKPSSGTSYSYWKQIGLVAQSSSAGGISDTALYSDGWIRWTGMEVNIGTVSSYDQATGNPTTGDEMSLNHVDTPAITNIENYNIDNKLSLSGNLAGGATGKIHDGYVILQCSLNSSAEVGGRSEKITWTYVEW